MFDGLCGTKIGNKHPVNKQIYSKLGSKEFSDCVKFVSSLPHVKSLNLELGEDLSGAVFWRLKTTLIEVVWGNLFPSLFCCFFKEVKEVLELPGTAVRHKTVITEFVMNDPNAEVVSFFKAKTDQFTLADVYQLRLKDGKCFEVVLQEDKLIPALNIDPAFYSQVGRVFCIIFNKIFAKTGTESVVESFYRTVENQEMNGRQSFDVLAKRAKVDWCFPNAIICEKALKEMAQIYIEGDKTMNLKRHYVPIHCDKRSKQKHSNEASKVITRLQNAELKFPFLFD